MSGQRITKAENDKRIDMCLELRFQTNPPMLQKEWIQYCHETYNDKSEITYHKYWSDARNKYEEVWRSKLSNLLEPAIDELYSLLSSDDEKIRSRALDQIMKYSGNDIQQIEAKIQGNIELKWGGDEVKPTSSDSNL